MEVLQLTIYELAPQNILEILPRFKIPGGQKDEIAIAKFAQTIGEIRLDQLPDDLAGHGKSDRHIQTVAPIEIFLENPSNDNSFPEISSQRTTHGYVEHYFVVGKNKRCYWYTRYVYKSISGKLKHHHIGKKQSETIFTLWRSGASAKGICSAIGKKYLGES